MKLKKLQMAAAALMVSATVTYAGSPEIYLLTGSTDVGSQRSMTTYGFGYGGSNKDLSRDTQILYGMDLEVLSATTELQSSDVAINMLLKAGYRYKRLSVYGLGGMIVDGYTGMDSLGFGYGGSAEFDIWRADSKRKSVVVGVEYITASMENAVDYEYTSNSMNGYLKYAW